MASKPHISLDIEIVGQALAELHEASEGWPDDNRYVRAAVAGEQALKRLEEQFETAQRDRDKWFGLVCVLRGLLEDAPQPDTDPHRLADPDGVGHSEVERCNELSPDGTMLCDREPRHEGKHVNWRGAEWSRGSVPLILKDAADSASDLTDEEKFGPSEYTP